MEAKGVAAETKKKSILETLKSFGPGIVVALTALGAGDLVDSSVAGSHYGYDLMWVLVIAIFVRFVIVNIMARADMCNNEGITLVESFSRLNKFYPFLFAGAAIIMGHLQMAYMIKGSAEAVRNLVGSGATWMWAIVVVCVSLFTLGRDVYKKLETVMKVLLAIMTAGFVGLAIATGPDVGAMVKGTVGFGIPAETGIFGAIMLAMSLVGAVAGSLTNFLYCRFIRDKGWRDPSHKKLQRNDLLFGLGMMTFINLAIWVVGAQMLKPQGIEVKDMTDISKALTIAFGPVGHVAFYLGVFGALWSSVLGTAVGYTKIACENIGFISSKYTVKNDDVLEQHPLYRWIILFVLISPIVWSVPGAPSFVVLVVVVNAINALFLPAIAVGILIISNKKEFLGKYTNNVAENIVLTGTVILAVWGGIKIAMEFLS